MPPIREYNNWNTCVSDEEEQIEPFRKYYFLCEGANTEQWYFKKFINMRKEFAIRADINMIYLDKTEADAGRSSPSALVAFAKVQRSQEAFSFDDEIDKMIIVFDLDVFEPEYKGFQEVIDKVDDSIILGVTNPSFELFLLLHYENAVEQYILPKKKEILSNEWVGTGANRKRFVHRYFTEISSINPKKNSGIENLVQYLPYAILEEAKLNTDIASCGGTLTCNIGSILQTIIADRGNLP